MGVVPSTIGVSDVEVDSGSEAFDGWALIVFDLVRWHVCASKVVWENGYSPEARLVEVWRLAVDGSAKELNGVMNPCSSWMLWLAGTPNIGAMGLGAPAQIGCTSEQRGREGRDGSLAMRSREGRPPWRCFGAIG